MSFLWVITMNVPANGLLVSLIRAGIIQDDQSGLLQERARNEKKL